SRVSGDEVVGQELFLAHLFIQRIEGFLKDLQIFYVRLSHPLQDSILRMLRRYFELSRDMMFYNILKIRLAAYRIPQDHIVPYTRCDKDFFYPCDIPECAQERP